MFPQLPSRKSIKKAIKKGEILLNGKQIEEGRFIQEGDEIELKLAQSKVYEFEVPVVFEDEYLAIINKPAGIPISGNQFKTIANALPFNLRPSSKKDGVTPKPIHRLDALTSGLLLIGKTASSVIELSKMFECKKIQKSYQAIVHGHAPKIGNIDFPIEGKESVSHYRSKKIAENKYVGPISLMALEPKTGRTHQLRIHLCKLGYPIVGDKLHSGEQEIYSGKGLFLTATRLEFIHPFTKEKMKIEISTPNKFDKLMSQ